jgi:hypothetical protein
MLIINKKNINFHFLLDFIIFFYYFNLGYLV